MKTFPMFLQMAGRRVVIAGGGEQAAQKSRLMLKTEAEITLLAPELDDELASLVDHKRAKHDAGPITPATFADTALTFIATGCPGCDAALHALAKEGGAVVNVVDQPELCDAVTPSIVDRDPVVVAIGTEGNAPVLGRQIKTQVETLLEPGLGQFVALAGRLRGAVAARVPRERRREFWRWVFAETPRRRHAAGAEREAAMMVKDAIAAGGAPDDAGKGVLTVMAIPQAADLLTLRAVQRLQEADVIFHDPDASAALELARRDAERIGSAFDTPSKRTAALAMSRAGQRVVWLGEGGSLRDEDGVEVL
ncbi:NAD(P)-dependent oxidoreductase [Actibacterium pelagium]|uniref:precorrin-2 dehydrogenase n=1 Tax=Actibacterium pelagium TaxID=2029103 RepID=A0A917AGH2_9RHOB|nr:NAD(P)-dependent oxidoreductase [Actibacterium pelagium]GGE51094.1 hypothetical protein GCM10011517_18580 [Actibacterium pelagium]